MWHQWQQKVAVKQAEKLFQIQLTSYFHESESFGKILPNYLLEWNWSILIFYKNIFC